jgi:hypothetical protein
MKSPRLIRIPLVPHFVSGVIHDRPVVEFVRSSGKRRASSAPLASKLVRARGVSSYLAFLLSLIVSQWFLSSGHLDAAPPDGAREARSASETSGKVGDNSHAGLVRRHLASLPGYVPGFIISKSDVAPIFAQLKKAGWNAKELERVYGAVVDDGHFLVRQLRSPQGYKFMQTAGKFQLNYDRMDRVSQVKGGQQAIVNTVQLPNGASFWNPNAKPGFANTARMLPTRGGRRRSAAEFSRPTGKIYTESQLVKQLAAVRAKKQDSNSAPENR